MGDRVAILRDGVLQQLGTPDQIYDRPVNVFVAGFIGSPSMNLIDARAGGDASVLFGSSRLPLPVGVRRPAPTAAGSRARHPARGLRTAAADGRARVDHPPGRVAGLGAGRLPRRRPSTGWRSRPGWSAARTSRRAARSDWRSTCDRLYFFDPDERRGDRLSASARALSPHQQADDLVRAVGELDLVTVRSGSAAPGPPAGCTAPRRVNGTPTRDARGAACAVRLVQPQHQRIGVLGALDRVEYQVGVVDREERMRLQLRPAPSEVASRTAPPRPPRPPRASRRCAASPRRRTGARPCPPVGRAWSVSAAG